MVLVVIMWGCLIFGFWSTLFVSVAGCLFVAGCLCFGWFSVACMLFCSVCVVVAAFRLLLIVLGTSHIDASCFSGWCLLLGFLALWFIGFR